LGDIGAPEAIEDLRSLSRDSNRIVAESAKTNLLGIETPHPYPFVPCRTGDSEFQYVNDQMIGGFPPPRGQDAFGCPRDVLQA
jgi:hypothetical protein